MSKDQATPALPDSLSKPDIPADVLAEWQRIVDLMAGIIGVPAGLIMRVHPAESEIEVFVSSDTAGNPYERGERASLNTGLYCEQVMADQAPLLVPDARRDPEWDHNPDIELGMVSYLGFPLEWPDGEVFGTICVLDAQESTYNDTYQELMRRFRAIVETHLKLLWETCGHERAEEALRESEELLRTIAANYPAYFSIIEPGEKDLIVGFTSGKEFAKQNLDPESFVGLTIGQVFGESASIVRESYLKAFGGDEISFELYINDQYQFCTAMPLYDENGAVPRILAVVEDITERKQAEEALREYQQRLEAQNAELRKLTQAVEQSANTVVITDLEGDIEYANPKFVETTGYTAEEALGQNPRILKSGDQSDDYYKELWQTITSGREWRGEFHNKRKDGTLYWELASIAPIYDAQGRMTHFIATKEDITERKRAEDALRRSNQELALLNRAAQAFNSILDSDQVLATVLEEVRRLLDVTACSIWLTDAETGELVCRQSVGPHSEAVLGLCLAPGEGLAGWVVRSGESLIVPDAQTDERYYRQVEQQVGLEMHSVLSVSLQIKDDVIGVLQVVDVAVGRFEPADQALLETLAASAAIAIDNARLVEALRSYTAELEARNEELDAFAHTAAHDLKGPLGPIVGIAQVLEQGYVSPSDERLHDYLRKIARNGRKMGRIIDELLLLAGVRQMEVDAGPLDMASIVAEARERLADMIEEYEDKKHPSAEVILPAAGDWPQALGYGPWVEEVWANYLSNALKYGGRPDGGVPPRVELGYDDSYTRTFVRFWVRDDGPGLTPEEQARLFTPFTRLNQVRTKGHGLGLSIVRRIVEKLGGEVGVESEIGSGSLFWFTLPRG